MAFLPATPPARSRPPPTSTGATASTTPGPLYAAAVYVGYTRVHADRHSWGAIAGSAAVSAAATWWLVKPAGDRGVAVLPQIGPHGVGVEVAARW